MAIITHSFCFLPVHRKEDQDLSPSGIQMGDLCQTDLSQDNTTLPCYCYDIKLKHLLREIEALETERDLLRTKVSQCADDYEESGSGSGYIF